MFSFETRESVTDFDDNNNVIGTSVRTEKGTVSYGLSTGELRVDNSDGTGFSVTVNPMITNAILGWIKSNIKDTEEQNKRERLQSDKEHEERMKSLCAQSAEAQLRLEEEALRHEIRMTELRIELAQRRKELAEAEAEVPAE